MGTCHCGRWGPNTGREERCRHLMWRVLGLYRKHPQQLQVSSGGPRGYTVTCQLCLLQPLSTNLRKDPATFTNCKNSHPPYFVLGGTSAPVRMNILTWRNVRDTRPLSQAGRVSFFSDPGDFVVKTMLDLRRRPATLVSWPCV